LFAALDASGKSTRLVGGAVRDSLLNLELNDIDLATVFPPDEVIRRLAKTGIRAIPTGIAHGTITAIVDSQPFEITTLRRDVATAGRHATVAFTDRWIDDARRRDFTINALYADLITGEITDFVDGIADLAAHRVRYIGDPLKRIAEDHLRILRFFRFHARFGRGGPDPAGLAACVARANDLMALSRERVRDEVMKLLAVADPAPTVRVMADTGIFAPVLPEIARGRVDDLAALVAAETAEGIAAGAIRRLATLLPPDPGAMDAVATRLRLSNADRRRLVLTATRDGSLAELAYRDGLASAVDRGLLRGDGDVSAFAVAWRKPVLPLSGGDLIARGVPVGPAVSHTLGAVERAWIAAGFPTDLAPILAQILR